jgi:hypothetical protein
VSTLIGFTGDIFLGHSTAEDVFSNLAEHLGADVTLVANFEGTLFRHRSQLRPVRRKILLDSPAGLFKAVQRLNVGIVCIGNNHIGDYGNEIADVTRKEIACHYPVFGAGFEGEPFHTIVWQHNGIRIGLASYSTPDCTPLFSCPTVTGPRKFNYNLARADLTQLRSCSDHCIAMLHWGDEDYHLPRVDQIAIARALIDAGYSAVIGSHSHTAQGYERYKDGWIFYSLGNFYFPDHHVMVDGETYRVQWMPRRSWGLLPIFEFTGNVIALKRVEIVRQNRNSAPFVTNRAFDRIRLTTYSRMLRLSRYAAIIRAWRAVEAKGTRLEEFLNNPTKAKTIKRKLFRFVGINRSAQEARSSA